MKVNNSAKLSFKIIQLITCLILMVHWGGCMWILLVRGQDWIPSNDLNA
jgi:hypothetical protein